MPGRATVDRAAPALFVLGHMRRHAQTAQVPDEVARGVGAVGAQRGRSPDTAFEHRQGGVAFGVATGLGQLDIDHQAVTVLGQHMAQVAEPGRLLLTFAVEPRLGIGRRLMRVAAADLARRADGNSCARPRPRAACRRR